MIYTHRGTAEHIAECIESQCISLSKYNKSLKLLHLIDHNKACIWVSTGYPTWWTYFFSGMLQYHFSKSPRKSYIVFETAEEAKRPSGVKRIFFYSQRVFEHDIHFSEVKILQSKQTPSTFH